MNYQPTWPPVPQPQPKRKSRGPLIALVCILGAFLLCGVGIVAVAAGATGTGNRPAIVVDADRSGTPTPPAHLVPTEPAKVLAPTTPAAAPTKPAAPAKARVDDGTWSVGPDIPAGIYKTVGAGSSCYWAIYKSGTNHEDIVSNDLGGGNLRVTLKSGQDFRTSDCGVWVQQ